MNFMWPMKKSTSSSTSIIMSVWCRTYKHLKLSRSKISSALILKVNMLLRYQKTFHSQTVLKFIYSMEVSSPRFVIVEISSKPLWDKNIATPFILLTFSSIWLTSIKNFINSMNFFNRCRKSAISRLEKSFTTMKLPNNILLSSFSRISVRRKNVSI